MPKFRRLTIQEVVEQLELDSDMEGAEVAILPPNDNFEASDVEDVNEDALEEVQPVDVCGELDVEFVTNGNEEDSEDEYLVNLKEPQPAKRSKKSGLQKVLPKWAKGSAFDQPMIEGSPQRLADRRSDLINKTPFELFVEIFGEDYFNYLAGMTNLYAKQKLAEINTNADEIVRFFGILLFSGYHKVPSERHYWSTAEDLSNNIVPKIMNRKRFCDLKQYFHLVDNLKLSPGKAAKVVPFYDHLSSQFVKISGVFTEELSIDESMVPYYGHHSLT